MATTTLRDRWHHLKESPAGRRFRDFHDEERRTRPSWVRPVYFVAAFVSLGSYVRRTRIKRPGTMSPVDVTRSAPSAIRSMRSGSAGARVISPPS